MAKTIDKKTEILSLAELAARAEVENPVQSVVDAQTRIDALKSIGDRLRETQGSGESRIGDRNLQIDIRRVLGFIDDDCDLAEDVGFRNERETGRIARRRPSIVSSSCSTGKLRDRIPILTDSNLGVVGAGLFWFTYTGAINTFDDFNEIGDLLSQIAFWGCVVGSLGSVAFTIYHCFGFKQGYGILRSTNPKPLLEDVVTKSTGKPDLVTRIEAIKAYDELVNRQAQIGIVEKLHEENPGCSDFRSAMIDSLRSRDGLTLRTAIDGHIASRTNFGNLSKTVKEEDVGSITIPDFDSPLYQSA